MDEYSIVYIMIGPITTHDLDKKVFRVKKSLIMEKSAYFRGLILSNPETFEIILNCEYTHMFKIALDFINGSNLDDIEDLETILLLDNMADMYGIDDLGKACEKMMAKFVSFQTAWEIYDNCKYERVIETCEWLLTTRAQDALSRQEFLKIKPETLSRFLRLEEMNIESETVLSEACIRFAASGNHGPEKEVFREYALPYLRVLKLSETGINNLQSYLTQGEYNFLRFRTKLSKTPAPEVPGLCLKKKDRRPANACTLVIEPDKDIYDKCDLALDSPYVKSLTQRDRFVLSFVTKKRVMLQRTVFFCPRLMRSFEDRVVNLTVSNSPPAPHPVAIVKLSLQKNGTREPSEFIFEINPCEISMNRIASVKMNNIEVGKAVRVTIEIDIHAALGFYKFVKSESTIFESSDPSIKEVLRKVKLKHLHDGKELEEAWNTTIFKSVHMKLI